MSGGFSDFEAFSGRQKAVAQAAFSSWYDSLSPKQQEALDGLPPAHIYSRSSGLDRDVAESVSASVEIDVAEFADRPVDLLIEGFGLSEEQAARVLRWHQSVVVREAEAAKAIQLSRIIGMLIRPMKDVRAVILGLAMASGLVGQMSLNGFASGAAAARDLGKHRATLSHWKRAWQKLLGLQDETFGKSDLAKETYKQKRMEVVMREKARRKS